MRPAPISLTTYFVRELQFKLNESFQPSTPYIPVIEDLDLTPSATAKAEDRRIWDVGLRLELNPALGRNAPYRLLIEVAGIVQVDSSVAEQNIERFVQINGTSVLFGAAREIVRAVTSRGPHGQIMLPTVTFWEPRPQPEPEVKQPETAAVTDKDLTKVGQSESL